MASLGERQVRSERVGKYLLYQTIGKGTFGKCVTVRTWWDELARSHRDGAGKQAVLPSRVKIAYHEEDGLWFAIKVLNRTDIKHNELSWQVKREITIMKNLSHPCIVQLHEVLCSPTKLYIVLELVMGKELFEILSEKGPFSEDMARRFFQQLTDAVSYCHAMQIVHRDLKPENILVTNSKYLKITDFGFSNMRNDSDVLHTLCGTPQYCAPEILAGNNDGYNGVKADAWSCGIILFTLLTGSLPFTGDTATTGPGSSHVRGDGDIPSRTGGRSDLYEGAMDAYYYSLMGEIQACEVKYPPSISAGAREVISRLLVLDPAERATLMDIMDLDWFQTKYEPCKPSERPHKRLRETKEPVDDWTSSATVATPKFLPTRKPGEALSRGRKPHSATEPPSSRRRTAAAVALRRASGDASRNDELGMNLALRPQNHAKRGVEVPVLTMAAAPVTFRKPMRSSGTGLYAEREAVSPRPSPGPDANAAVKDGSTVYTSSVYSSSRGGSVQGERPRWLSVAASQGRMSQTSPEIVAPQVDAVLAPRRVDTLADDSTHSECKETGTATEEEEARGSDGSGSDEYEEDEDEEDDGEVFEYDDVQPEALEPDDPSLSLPHESISMESFSAAVTLVEDEVAGSQSQLAVSSAPDILGTGRPRVPLPATPMPGFDCKPDTTVGYQEHAFEHSVPPALLASLCDSDGARLRQGSSARLHKVEAGTDEEGLAEYSLRDGNLSEEDDYVEPTTLRSWPPVEAPATPRPRQVVGMQAEVMAVTPLGRRGVDLSAAVSQGSPSAMSGDSPSGPVSCPSPARNMGSQAVPVHIRPAQIAAAAAATSIQTGGAPERSVTDTATGSAARGRAATGGDPGGNVPLAASTIRSPVSPQYAFASPWTPEKVGPVGSPSDGRHDASLPERAGRTSHRSRTGQVVSELADPHASATNGGTDLPGAHERLLAQSPNAPPSSLHAAAEASAGYWPVPPPMQDPASGAPAKNGRTWIDNDSVEDSRTKRQMKLAAAPVPAPSRTAPSRRPPQAIRWRGGVAVGSSRGATAGSRRGGDASPRSSKSNPGESVGSSKPSVSNGEVGRRQLHDAPASASVDGQTLSHAANFEQYSQDNVGGVVDAVHGPANAESGQQSVAAPQFHETEAGVGSGGGPVGRPTMPAGGGLLLSYPRGVDLASEATSPETPVTPAYASRGGGTTAPQHGRQVGGDPSARPSSTPAQAPAPVPAAASTTAHPTQSPPPLPLPLPPNTPPPASPPTQLVPLPAIAAFVWQLVQWWRDQTADNVTIFTELRTIVTRLIKEAEGATAEAAHNERMWLIAFLEGLQVCVWGELNKTGGLSEGVAAVPVRKVLVATGNEAPAPGEQGTYGGGTREGGSSSLGGIGDPDRDGSTLVPAPLSPYPVRPLGAVGVTPMARPAPEKADYDGGPTDRLGRPVPSAYGINGYDDNADDEGGESSSFLHARNPHHARADDGHDGGVAYGSRETTAIHESTLAGYSDRYTRVGPPGLAPALSAEPWRRLHDEEVIQSNGDYIDGGLAGPPPDADVQAQLAASAAAVEAASATVTGATTVEETATALVGEHNCCCRTAPLSSGAATDLSSPPTRPDRQRPKREQGRRGDLLRAAVVATPGRGDSSNAVDAAAPSSNAGAGLPTSDAPPVYENETAEQSSGAGRASVSLRSASPSSSRGGAPGATSERSPLPQQSASLPLSGTSQPGTAHSSSGYGSVYGGSSINGGVSGYGGDSDNVGRSGYGGDSVNGRGSDHGEGRRGVYGYSRPDPRQRPIIGDFTPVSKPLPMAVSMGLQDVAYYDADSRRRAGFRTVLRGVLRSVSRPLDQRLAEERSQFTTSLPVPVVMNLLAKTLARMGSGVTIKRATRRKMKVVVAFAGGHVVRLIPGRPDTTYSSSSHLSVEGAGEANSSDGQGRTAADDPTTEQQLLHAVVHVDDAMAREEPTPVGERGDSGDTRPAESLTTTAAALVGGVGSSTAGAVSGGGSLSNAGVGSGGGGGGKGHSSGGGGGGGHRVISFARSREDRGRVSSDLFVAHFHNVRERFAQKVHALYQRSAADARRVGGGAPPQTEGGGKRATRSGRGGTSGRSGTTVS